MKIFDKKTTINGTYHVTETRWYLFGFIPVQTRQFIDDDTNIKSYAFLIVTRYGK